ncbi:hypothetical protein HYX00_02510 [Candidatus Woesearchaeota archaeon]|nr:hypothetical protein [Candidatus Woesearchaeota archaeon]
MGIDERLLTRRELLRRAGAAITVGSIPIIGGSKRAKAHGSEGPPLYLPESQTVRQYSLIDGGIEKAQTNDGIEKLLYSRQTRNTLQGRALSASDGNTGLEHIVVVFRQGSSAQNPSEFDIHIGVTDPSGYFVIDPQSNQGYSFHVNLCDQSIAPINQIASGNYLFGAPEFITGRTEPPGNFDPGFYPFQQPVNLGEGMNVKNVQLIRQRSDSLNIDPQTGQPLDLLKWFKYMTGTNGDDPNRNPDNNPKGSTVLGGFLTPEARPIRIYAANISDIAEAGRHWENNSGTFHRLFEYIQSDDIPTDGSFIQNAVYVVRGGISGHVRPQDSRTPTRRYYTSGAIIYFPILSDSMTKQHELGHLFFRLEGQRRNTVFPGINFNHRMNGGSSTNVTLLEAVAAAVENYLWNSTNGYTDMRYYKPRTQQNILNGAVATLIGQRLCVG